MALSTSLIENLERSDLELAGVANPDSVLRALKKAETAKTNKKVAKKGKQKAAPVVHLLTSVTREEARQRLSERVARYIFSAGDAESLVKTPPFKKRKCDGGGADVGKKSTLWSRSHYGDWDVAEEDLNDSVLPARLVFSKP